MEIETEPLIERIKKDHQALFLRFDPNACIAFFDQVPNQNSYHFVPAGVAGIWAAINHEFGEAGFEAYQKATLLYLIGNFGARSKGKRYTASIQACFDNSFRRIVNSIADLEFAHYRTHNDILLKDLGLCRQKLFPAGAAVIELDSGFHRSLMFRGGISQAYRMVTLLMATGGNTPWYLFHTHLSELEEFNSDGRDRCYLRLAEMLTLNPDVRGVWGGSWYYDPAIEKVSPRLAYLRKVPQAGGARVFYSGVDIDGGALSKSESRRKAYKNGEYLPKAYAIIWPRQEILAWAAARRDGSVVSN